MVGAGSFIGQHLIRKLIDNGDHVTGLFRKRPDKAEKWMKDVKVASGDITEKSSIAGICKEIEIVYHLAAKVHDFSNKGNTADEHSAVNVSGIKNVLDECINSGIKHFVYFSRVKGGGKSFLLTNPLIQILLVYDQTIKNPVSGSVLPCHLPWKRAKGDIFRRAGP